MYLAILGLVFMAFGVVAYVKKVKKNNAPKYPIILFTSLFIAIGLDITGIIQQIENGSVLSLTITVILTLLPLILLSIFSFFLLQKKPALGNITVSVGSQILPFKATTSNGLPFSSDELKGKRTLFKFYRGGWCPYCSAELKMFEEMKEDLNKYNIQIVGLCNETPDVISKHIQRDSLTHTLLSDPNLNVIRQYGVEHHKVLSNSAAGSVKILGISLPVNLSYQTMPIPTSILINEHGTIQWIDQSEDFRLRASKERVMTALRQAF